MLSLAALWLLDMLMVFMAEMLSISAKSLKALHISVSPYIIAQISDFLPDNEPIRRASLRGYFFFGMEADVYFDSS